MIFKVLTPIIFNLCLLINAIPSGHDGKADDKKCGYESCAEIKADMLNVHLVAHTHDDVGWLKTVDQYYYGSKGSIQKATVEAIIDSVIQALLGNPARRFIYVESAFFTKWWNEQDDDLKEKVKMLVSEGRLEFIGGAWSMNDEAATHYQSIIDQFTWGLRFLNDTFGECARPKIGWQIDPFGHSREQASLFTQMGYDGLFFARLDYQDKIKRIREKSMEMIWKSSQSLDDSELFTGALNNTWYNAPDLFCFDIVCSDEPIIDDINSPDYNVERRVAEFENVLRKQASSYRSNNIMLTMGGDFTYMAAQMYFKGMDKLIKATNERQDKLKINVFYSTPACYLKSLHDSDVKWPTKSDDFFPYASDPYSYWTGYYTSRPASKRFERMGNQFLQICKKLSAAAASREESFDENLARLLGIMGVMQHHDAITGTEKQHVADDYHRELHAAITGCEANTRSSLNQLTTGKEPTGSATQWDFQFNSCLHLNISVCSVPEASEKFMLTVYNPLSHASNEFVRFPVGGSRYEVRDADDKVVNHQLVPIPMSLMELHYRTSAASNEVVFQAAAVPPLGFKSYFVTRVASTQQKSSHNILAEETTIGNAELSLKFGTDGLLSEITIDGATSMVSQNFFIYKGALNNNEIFANRSSGAYIFRPDPVESVDPSSPEATLTVIRGEVVEEVHQVFNEWISQVVRVYKTEKFVEFEWMVGPIDVDDGVGKEIITRFSSNIQTDGFFFTDSNGRQMLKRKRDERETWDVEMAEPVSGNYYPITSKIAIEDGNKRLAVLTDRACGGSSMIDGTVELMVHRRLLKDDTFGVDEALNETAYDQGLVVRGKHWLMFGQQTTQSPTLAARERLLQNRVLMSNWLFFDSVATTYEDWRKDKKHSHSSIGAELPQNVYLMTFEPWKKDSFLIRFEHILEKDEDPELSEPVSFNLTHVFPGDFVFAEVTLAGNQWIEDKSRLQFQAEGTKSKPQKSFPKTAGHKLLTDMRISLNPMEIRTFIMSPPYEDSHGIKSQTVFKFFPIIILTVIFRNFL